MRSDSKRFTVFAFIALLTISGCRNVSTTSSRNSLSQHHSNPNPTCEPADSPACNPSWASSPVILYTDITSGPNTGGQNSEGSFVRIFGKRFGATQGTSFVTIGKGRVAHYPVWSDTEIVVQLGALAQSGDIVVSTGADLSNGVPFTVRPGNIYFVDLGNPNPGSGTFANPWNSPRSCVQNAVAGDICYLRTGTYSQQYDGDWPANFDLRAGHGGAPGLPIAYLGYPGERPFFTGFRNVVMWHSSWKSAGHLVFANIEATPINGVFVLNTDSANALSNNPGAEDLRFVNIKVHGIASVGATGIFKLAGDNNVCLGNEIYDNHAPEAKNLAHSFYPSNGLDNLVIAYNHMHDNDWGPNGGFEISVHTDGIAVNGPDSVDTMNARIFNNRIESGTGSIRGIGVGRVGENSAIYIYNNTVSVNQWSAIFAAGGYVYAYNNTLEVNGPGGISVFLFNGPSLYPGIQGGEIINNIVLASSPAHYYPTTNNFVTNFNVISNNLYWGPDAVPTVDTSPLFGDPNSFTDLTIGAP